VVLLACEGFFFSCNSFNACFFGLEVVYLTSLFLAFCSGGEGGCVLVGLVYWEFFSPILVGNAEGELYISGLSG